MKTIKTVENQTIMDVAVQAYGNREAVFQIIADNPNILNTAVGDFSFASELAVNQELNIRTEGDLVKQKVVRDIPNKVTTYKKDVEGGKIEPYLADETGTYITTETGENIIVL
jgi:hypothetical protein